MLDNLRAAVRASRFHGGDAPAADGVPACVRQQQTHLPLLVEVRFLSADAPPHCVPPDLPTAVRVVQAAAQFSPTCGRTAAAANAQSPASDAPVQHYARRSVHAAS